MSNGSNSCDHPRRILAALAAAVLACALPACSSSDKDDDVEDLPPPAAVDSLSVRDSIEISVTAKVKAVDYATRDMTLRDADGHEVSFKVDPAVQRLQEVKVGDSVSARYRASLLAELRPPTAEEAANPLAMVAIEGRTPQGSTPAAGAVQALRVVTTVAAVDAPNMLITLRGPMNDLMLVRGKKPENVKRLRVRDTIVIFFSETIVIGLEKAPG